MTDSYEEKINEYMKLIREHGSKKAAEIIKKRGISFNENFTETHITDPIFSEPIPLLQREHIKTVNAWQLDFSPSADKRIIFQQNNNTINLTSPSTEGLVINLIPEALENGTGTNKINVERAISSSS